MTTFTSGDWILNAGPFSTTLSPDRESSYSFDLEGRPLSWLIRETLFRRTLASEVHGRSGQGAGRQRWRLSGEETRAALAAVAACAAAAPRPEAGSELEARLETIRRWNVDNLLEEAARFRAAYEPIGILPPDQYRALVLQATIGCTWNRCAFCSFYQDRPFRARGPQAFREHASRVAALLGRAAVLRDRIFLADGDALTLSNERLRPIFAAAREVFPDRPLAGFVEAHAGGRKPAGDWEELRELGLQRICLGLESGHEPLLRLLNKPASAAEAGQVVGDLKAAGLSVAVVLLCGAGGERYAGPHVDDSLDLLRRLPLGAGDIVYLSPFVLHGGSEYARRLQEQGIRPMGPEAVEAQLAALRSGARAALPGVKAVRYDIREFLY